MDNVETNTQEVQEEKGLTFKELLFIIKKNIISIVIILAVFLGLGIGYNYLKAPSYKSTGTILVSYNKSNETAISTSYSFSSYISDTYVLFLTEDVVLSKVSEKVDIPVRTLKNNLKASNDSLIITVSYTCNDPIKAQEVVDAVIDSAKEVANQGTKDDPKYPLLYGNLSDLSPAKVGSKVSSTVTNVVIFFAAGLVVAFVYVLLRELLDNRFKSTEDIERTLGIPVLAGIPDYTLDDEKGGKK